MLKQIEHILNNPNDLPNVPRVVKEYLQSRYNAAYLYEHIIPQLQQEGRSESFIAGVTFGFHLAAKVLDEMEAVRNFNSEEDE
ncbi:hypothetical protein Q19_31 [Pectobacterium phage Q19]|uniref:Phage protein n=1 Tax=Pectobacterium phage Q19 TaxID=2500576 RepID=A0A678ZXN2_9CAUD|nr:hypothetical protein Q19_31 [Pectobacterium phage Q19]